MSRPTSWSSPSTEPLRSLRLLRRRDELDEERRRFGAWRAAPSQNAGSRATRAMASRAKGSTGIVARDRGRVEAQRKRRIGGELVGVGERDLPVEDAQAAPEIFLVRPLAADARRRAGDDLLASAGDGARVPVVVGHERSRPSAPSSSTRVVGHRADAAPGSPCSRDGLLLFEGQPVAAPPRVMVQVVAHRPEKLARGVDLVGLARHEHAEPHQIAERSPRASGRAPPTARRRDRAAPLPRSSRRARAGTPSRRSAGGARLTSLSSRPMNAAARPR